jgi:hypothetical protein
MIFLNKCVINETCDTMMNNIQIVSIEIIQYIVCKVRLVDLLDISIRDNCVKIIDDRTTCSSIYMCYVQVQIGRTIFSIVVQR